MNRAAAFILSGGFLVIASGAFAAEPVALSSETVASPYDLVLGSAAPTPELASMPWHNEELSYQVKWGFIDVGTSTLSAHQIDNFNGRTAVRIMSQATSNGFCDTFYKVRDLNESWVDARTFSSLGYSKHLREGHFFRDEWVVYDYAHGDYISRRIGRDGNYSVAVGTMPVPVQDILSSMYYLRTKPLHVGDEVVMDVNTRATWPLVARVLRKTKIKVPAGTFNCVVVEPALRHEGIFVQKGKRLQVYMTDDDRHIPVYMSVEVFFGTVTASLSQISYATQ